MHESPSFWPLAALRWASYLAVFVAIGAASLRRLMDRLPGGSAAHGRTGLEARAAGAGAAAGMALVLLAALRLYGQTRAMFGLEEPVTAELMQVIALETRWGSGWLAQLGAALAMITTFALARHRPRPWWALASLAALAAAAATVLTGHAVATDGWLSLSVAVAAAHVVAAALWIGTLAALLVASGSGSVRATRALVESFSAVARASVAMLLVAAAALAWQHVGSASALLGTGYGRMLLLKGAVVVGVLGCGWYNWRRLSRHGTGAPDLGAVARLELALAIAVLAATAILAALPLPGE